MCPVMPQDESGDRLDSSSENQIIVILSQTVWQMLSFLLAKWNSDLFLVFDESGEQQHY